MKDSSQQRTAVHKPARPLARAACAFSLAAAAAWVFFEWLFFVTKPSFMGQFSAWEKAAALCLPVAVVSLGLLAITLPFFLAGLLARRLSVPAGMANTLTVLPAAVLASCTFLLLFDNFTLTVFDYGIRDSAGAAVWAYRVLWLAFLLLALRLAQGLFSERYPAWTSGVILKGVPALAVLALPLALLMAMNEVSGIDAARLDTPPESRPNIVILSGDGLAAEHMSVYGYDRPTTPFLDSIRDEFLMAENHFSNSADTGASIISMLTSKLPTTTRMVYPPDVLKSTDSVQHLPGLLQIAGYFTSDISMRHYADPYDLNLREGFNEANFRVLKADTLTPLGFLRQHAALNHAALLLERMLERLAQRFDHVWRGVAMPDPYAAVDVPDLRWISDKRRMVELTWVLGRAPRPLFLHVHTMGTHGNRFKPSERHWSTDADYPTPWHLDGYDDAVRDFDRMVQKTYELLKKKKLLDSTILVITSDHGFKHSTLERMPLMIRLPDASRAGMIPGNTQRLDLAPTLVDLLDLPIIDWMEGVSLVSVNSERAPDRLIFSTASRPEKAAEKNFWSVRMPKPPWYSMGRLFMVRCNQGFTLHLDSGEIEESPISGSSASCGTRLSAEQARSLMYGHLEKQGYEVPVDSK